MNWKQRKDKKKRYKRREEKRRYIREKERGERKTGVGESH